MGGKRKLLRGHYNPVKWERKQVNLQWGKLAGGGRIKVCTRCLKKGLNLTVKAAPTKSAAKKKSQPKKKSD